MNQWTCICLELIHSNNDDLLVIFILINHSLYKCLDAYEVMDYSNYNINYIHLSKIRCPRNCVKGGLGGITEVP